MSRNFAKFTNVVSTPPNLAMSVADLLTTVIHHSHDMRSRVVVSDSFPAIVVMLPYSFA